jgi:hypothetical protein
MSTEPKPQRITSRPSIPEDVLVRALEAATMPKGWQAGESRETGVRLLAHRLRADRELALAKAFNHAPDTWRNVSEFIGAALATADFKTLDTFCDAWLNLAGGQERMGQARNRAIAGKIIDLQRIYGRAPTNGEIVKAFEDDSLNGAGMVINKSSVNSFLGSHNLVNRLSKMKTGRKH